MVDVVGITRGDRSNVAVETQDVSADSPDTLRGGGAMPLRLRGRGAMLLLESSQRATATGSPASPALRR